GEVEDDAVVVVVHHVLLGGCAALDDDTRLSGAQLAVDGIADDQHVPIGLDALPAVVVHAVVAQPCLAGGRAARAGSINPPVAVAVDRVAVDHGEHAVHVDSRVGVAKNHTTADGQVGASGIGVRVHTIP